MSRAVAGAAARPTWAAGRRDGARPRGARGRGRRGGASGCSERLACARRDCPPDGRAISCDGHADERAHACNAARSQASVVASGGRPSAAAATAAFAIFAEYPMPVRASAISRKAVAGAAARLHAAGRRPARRVGVVRASAHAEVRRGAGDQQIAAMVRRMARPAAQDQQHRIVGTAVRVADDVVDLEVAGGAAPRHAALAVVAAPHEPAARGADRPPPASSTSRSDTATPCSRTRSARGRAASSP